MGSDRAARTIAALILMAAATFMALEIGWLARGLRFDLIPQAQAVVKKADVTLDNSNKALTVEQSKWDQELRETEKATADLHDLLIHTDISLNGRHGDGGILGDIHGRIVPNVVAVLDSSNLAVTRMGADLDRIGGTTDSMLGKVGPLIQALTVRVEDPTYDRILANADQSMQNIAVMTADTRQITGDTAAFVHRELAPIKGTWNVLKNFLFQIAGPAASVGAAFK